MPAEAIPFTQDQPAVQDWDDPPTCILWEDFRGTLTHVKRLGTLPPSHQSHDHLNEQVPVGVDEDSKSRWKSRFEQLKVVWVIVDGFVLYWDPVSAICSHQAKGMESCRDTDKPSLEMSLYHRSILMHD